MRIKEKVFPYEDWAEYVSQFVDFSNYSDDVIDFAWENFPFPYDAVTFLLGYQE